MPISPKPYLLQMYEEVISPKLPDEYFKNGDEFISKLRLVHIIIDQKLSSRKVF